MIETSEFVANLGAALAIGAVIGLERELRGHDSGIKTNALVAAGAAAFLMVSRILDDSGRVAAQVVTGIGFLGAGNIMRAGERVKGLTTAATLWIVAAAGMVAGTGRLRLAALVGAVTLTINIFLPPLEARLAKAYAKRQDAAAAETQSRDSQSR